MKTNDSFQNDPMVKGVQESSNFRAVKVLVETENTLRAAHNRIRVLEANESKNQQKLQTQLGTIEKIQSVRQAGNAHLTLIDSCRSQLERQTSEHSLKGKLMKSQHIQRREEALSEIREERKEHYLQTEENSLLAEKSISESRLRELRVKQGLRAHINREEDDARKRVLRFYEGKQERIKENKAGEVEALRGKEADRQRKIQNLGKIEMELIQRQSQSQAAYLEVKHKLDSLLSQVKLQNKRSKQDLKPSMHISQLPPSY